jgi:outer membrane protein
MQNEVQKLRATLDSAASDLERRSSMLSETQRAAKRKALADQQEQSEKKYRELQEKMVARERELLEPIQSRINSVIEGIRASGGYAIIFDIGAPNSGIFTSDRSLDLTQRVIQQLK